MADRRDALKIIGAIGTTCAFPFSADELYGQHVHPAPAAAPAEPSGPKHFTPAEFALVSRLADLIIPPTDTPGAVAAGVPAYIDRVVGANERHQPVFRDGLAWLERASAERHGRPFLELGEERQVGLLTPLSEAAERGKDGTAESFFRAVKSMTADGYYTSRIGLVQELGYAGNAVMGAFPSCAVEEH